MNKEIIIVDDFSTDNTRKILQSMMPSGNLKIMYQPATWARAPQSAKDSKPLPVISSLSRTPIWNTIGGLPGADSADPRQKSGRRFRFPLSGRAPQGLAVLAFGCKPHPDDSFQHADGFELTDMETCFKVFRSDILKRSRFVKPFGFEPEFTAKVGKARYRIFEVPISYCGRDYSEGKKVNWKDGVAALYFIFKYRFFD